jgi:hypothetical protein
MVHDHTDVIEGPGTLDQIAVRFDEQRAFCNRVVGSCRPQDLSDFR